MQAVKSRRYTNLEEETSSFETLMKKAMKKI